MTIGTRDLEALCRKQLGGGPWFFNERINTRVNPFPSRDYQPDFKPFRVQRMAGPEGGPLYVEGASWEDCARQLGITGSASR